mgnify:CR=1 FL=1
MNKPSRVLVALLFLIASSTAAHADFHFECRVDVAGSPGYGGYSFQLDRAGELSILWGNGSIRLNARHNLLSSNDITWENWPAGVSEATGDGSFTNHASIVVQRPTKLRPDLNTITVTFNCTQANGPATSLSAVHGGDGSRKLDSPVGSGGADPSRSVPASH